MVRWSAVPFRRPKRWATVPFQVAGILVAFIAVQNLAPLLVSSFISLPEPDLSRYDSISGNLGAAITMALVLPLTTVGFTDSRVLRRRGVQSYGFVPTLMDSSLAAGIHGHNERVPIESLRTGIQILFEVVRRFVA